ncbi:nucleotidyltransferase-like protein [Candidatus Symbiobacter mobilis CR]|uniref:Nucleotidyltransferase-like protein n=2 Tax=Candidatus Symbiobacter TaxID=1436289 RepID=U5NEM1_9BURK|nr:nucleotidyltransferase-like protein [Candidatus Symbiobacter mobilis CR]
MTEFHTLYLPEKYAEQVRDLLQKHIPEAEVWAYGSRVRGDFYDASDLDLVARFPSTKKRDVFRLCAMAEAFQESNLPIIVQIIDWDGIPNSFREEILAKYVVVQKGAGDAMD